MTSSCARDEFRLPEQRLSHRDRRHERNGHGCAAEHRRLGQQWVGKRSIALTAGVHVLAIVIETPYFSLNAIRVGGAPSTWRLARSWRGSRVREVTTLREVYDGKKCT